VKKCHKCGTTIELEEVFRRDECGACGADLHVCLNCEFHERGRANDCREPQAERVVEKDRSNYCDYFRFRKAGEASSGEGSAKKAWDDLFKK
jgi:hypothetical protein